MEPGDKKSMVCDVTSTLQGTYTVDVVGGGQEGRWPGTQEPQRHGAICYTQRLETFSALHFFIDF